ARKRYEEAIASLKNRKAAGEPGGQVDTYVRLADLLRSRLNRPDAADKVMDDMVADNPDSFQARLARGSYLGKIGLLEKAAQDIGRARDALAPGEADVLLASADRAQARGQGARARAALEEGARLHPDDFRFRLALAALEVRAGPARRAEALRRLH